MRRFVWMEWRKTDNQCMIGIIVSRVRSHIKLAPIRRYLANMANVKGDSLFIRLRSAKFF